MPREVLLADPQVRPPWRSTRRASRPPRPSASRTTRRPWPPGRRRPARPGPRGGPNLAKPNIPKPARQGGCYYNGMIYPLAPYAMAGVIWYQGESNVQHPGPVRPPAARHDRLLAEAVGPGRLPLPVRATGELRPAPGGALGQQLGPPARGAAQDPQRAQHRHGRDDRHRRGRQSAPAQQAGRRTAPGDGGHEGGLRARRGVLPGRSSSP